MFYPPCPPCELFRGMGDHRDYEPAYPLRLRWMKRQPDNTGAVWTAFDGPWDIGYVIDHSATYPKGSRGFSWQIMMLSSAQFRGSIQGRAWTGREAAEELEEAFFRLLPKAAAFEARLEDAMAYAEWLGIPYPAATDWMRRRHILGENPMPMLPLKNALWNWGQEERKRGRSGMLTPGLMAETYGENWKGGL